MGYTLLLSLIEYKTLVTRGDLERANEIFPSIPKEHHNRYMIFFRKFQYLLDHVLYIAFIYCLCLSLAVNKEILFASVAHFLESRNMPEAALEVATDPNYRFDLAVQLGRLEIAKVYFLIM